MDYRFGGGWLGVRVWPTNAMGAARGAMIELDYRVAKAGRRPSASGCKLTPVAEDA